MTTELTDQLLIKISPKLLELLDATLLKHKENTGEALTRNEYVRQMLFTKLTSKTPQYKEELQAISRAALLGNLTTILLKQCKEVAQTGKREFTFSLYWKGNMDHEPLQKLLGTEFADRYKKIKNTMYNEKEYSLFIEEILILLKEETGLNIENWENKKLEDLRITGNSIECYWHISWK